jgi:hypothetical protein
MKSISNKWKKWRRKQEIRIWYLLNWRLRSTRGVWKKSASDLRRYILWVMQDNNNNNEFSSSLWWSGRVFGVGNELHWIFIVERWRVWYGIKRFMVRYEYLWDLFTDDYFNDTRRFYFYPFLGATCNHNHYVCISFKWF